MKGKYEANLFISRDRQTREFQKFQECFSLQNWYQLKLGRLYLINVLLNRNLEELDYEF